MSSSIPPLRRTAWSTASAAGSCARCLLRFPSWTPGSGQPLSTSPVQGVQSPGVSPAPLGNHGQLQKAMVRQLPPSLCPKTQRAHCAQCPPVRLESEWVETLFVMELLFTSCSPAVSQLSALCLPLPLWSFAWNRHSFLGRVFHVDPGLPILYPGQWS